MRKLLIPVITAALVIAAMLYQAKTVEPVLCDAPDSKLGELEGFRSEQLQATESEKYVLPEDTIIDKRIYQSEDGAWYLVTLIIGGRSKSSIHRPEMCLPAQGFQMRDPREISVAGIEWHLVTLARREASSIGFAYTFFNQEGYRTSSHIARIFRDVWDRSILGRVDRWAMITVNSSVSDDAGMSAFLRKLKGVIAHD